MLIFSVLHLHQKKKKKKKKKLNRRYVKKRRLYEGRERAEKLSGKSGFIYKKFAADDLKEPTESSAEGTVAKTETKKNVSDSIFISPSSSSSRRFKPVAGLPAVSEKDGFPRLNCDYHQFICSAARPREYAPHQYPQVGIVGRTNSGKSSLLNQFMRGRRLAKSSSRPGVTKTLDFYHVDHKVMFVDTPGYGENLNARKLKRWKIMVSEFVRRSPNLRLLLLLVDIRHMPSDEDLGILALLAQNNNGLEVAFEYNDEQNNEISSLQNQAEKHKEPNLEHVRLPVPVMLVLTKDDKVTHEQRCRLYRRIKNRLRWRGRHVHYSIYDRRGRGHLLRHIMTTLYAPDLSLLVQDLVSEHHGGEPLWWGR